MLSLDSGANISNHLPVVLNKLKIEQVIPPIFVYVKPVKLFGVNEVYWCY